MIGRNEVMRVLEEDMAYRKMEKWPLVDISCPKVARDFSDSVFYISRGKLISKNSAIEDLCKHYTHLQYLLNKYNLCAAGGCIYKAIYGIGKPTDVDLFFYGLNLTEACRQLTEIVSYFKCKEYDILYGTYCTTISLTHSDGKYEEYQLIHRLYPSKDSIIGGFDLGSCASLYDGKNLLATPLGHFCITNQVNLFDTTRRSTTYEERIKKYMHDYGTGIVMVSVKITDSSQSKVTVVSDFMSIVGDKIRVHKKGMKSQRKYDYEIPTKNRKVTNYNLLFENRPEYLKWRENELQIDLPEMFHTYPLGYQKRWKPFHVISQLLYPLEDVGKFSINKYLLPDEIAKFAKRLKFINTASYSHEVHKLLLDIRELLFSKVRDNFSKFNYELSIDGPLSKTRWITENPGRQWTSSINPVFMNPKSYFRKNIYSSVRIGLPPDVETTIRLVLNHYNIPSHITKLILFRTLI
mgnify:FL=1